MANMIRYSAADMKSSVYMVFARENRSRYGPARNGIMTLGRLYITLNMA